MSKKPEIHLTYPHNIWNIFTAGDKYLLLEIRDDSTLSAYFDLYDFKNKQFVWIKLAFDEPWRIGISFCNEDIALLHQYAMGSVPSIEKLLAIDLYTGKKIWEVDKFQPLAFGNQYIKGLKEDQQKYIALQNGREIAEVDNFKEYDIMNMPVIPLRYLPDTDNFATVKQFLATFLNEAPEGVVEYLEYNQNMFIAYHRKKEDKFEVILLGISNDGNIWLNQKVDEGDKFSGDIFFIWNNHLVFVQGKHELKAIKLNGE